MNKEVVGDLLIIFLYSVIDLIILGGLYFIFGREVFLFVSIGYLVLSKNREKVSLYKEMEQSQEKKKEELNIPKRTHF